MAGKKEEKKKTLKEAIEYLNKTYSGAYNDDGYFISTGSIGLDAILGGGLKSGRLVELIAWEGAGKTTFCLHVLAEAQKAGYNVAYVDAEHALDKAYAENIGVDWDALLPTLFQPSNGEEAFEYGKTLLETGEMNLIIFDSTSGMLPKSQMEGETGASNIGKHAFLFNKEIPRINLLASKHNAICIFVSQIREKPGVMFGSPETTQAGHSLKFFASTRIDLRRTLTKDGDDTTGIKTKFKTLKCKTASPFQLAYVPIVFGLGFDKLDEAIELGKEYEILKKHGDKITIGEDKYTVEEFKTLLLDNTEFYSSLKEKITNKITKQPIKIEDDNTTISS